MFKLLGNKRLFILLAAFIIFIALMGLTLGDRKNLTWPEKFSKDVVSFSQGLIYKPAAYIAGFFQDMKTLHQTQEENKALKRAMSLYVKDTARLNYLEAEKKRLEDALAFTQRQRQLNDYTWHIAEVVSESPDPLSRTVNINLGSQDGIKLNMAVATSEGLIGRISGVAEFYSTVQLITDSEHNLSSTKAIAATVAGKPESFGMIESYDSTTGQLIMNKIQDTDPLAVGDTVITSGFGRVFPKGVEIGTVVSRKVGEFGITHTARIRPSATFYHLHHVFVIEEPEL